MKVRAPLTAVLVFAVLVGMAGCGSSGSMPRLVGLTGSRATRILNEAGYRNVTVHLSTSRVAAPGTVIAQTPVAGSGVNSGSSVSITVVGPLSVEPTRTHVSSAVVGHFRGIPGRSKMPKCVLGPGQSTTPCAAWAGLHTLYVATWGSSSCPRIPTSVLGLPPSRVVVTTVPHDFFAQDNGCTDDLTVTTSVIRVPDTVQTHKPVRVEIDGTILGLPPAPNPLRCPLCP